MNFRIISKDRFYRLFGEEHPEFTCIDINIPENFILRGWENHMYFALDDGTPFVLVSTLNKLIVSKKENAEDIREIVLSSRFSTDNYEIIKVSSEKPYTLNEYTREGNFLGGYKLKIPKDMEMPGTGKYIVIDQIWKDEYTFWTYEEKREYSEATYIIFDGKLDPEKSHEEIKQFKEFLSIIWIKNHCPMSLQASTTP